MPLITMPATNMFHDIRSKPNNFGWIEWDSTEPSISKWDIRFCSIAEQYASFSKDPSSKIGAIFVSPKNIVLSAGWNGFPRKVPDDEAKLNDRQTKYRYMVHAEMNAIYNACHNGISLDGSVLYVHGLPVCFECAKGVIQVGTRKVVCNWHGPIPEKWKESWENSKELFEMAGIETLILNEEFY